MGTFRKPVETHRKLKLIELQCNNIDIGLDKINRNGIFQPHC